MSDFQKSTARKYEWQQKSLRFNDPIVLQGTLKRKFQTRGSNWEGMTLSHGTKENSSSRKRISPVKYQQWNVSARTLNPQNQPQTQLKGKKRGFKYDYMRNYSNLQDRIQSALHSREERMKKRIFQDGRLQKNNSQSIKDNQIFNPVLSRSQSQSVIRERCFQTPEKQPMSIGIIPCLDKEQNQRESSKIHSLSAQDSPIQGLRGLVVEQHSKYSVFRRHSVFTYSGPPTQVRLRKSRPSSSRDLHSSSVVLI